MKKCGSFLPIFLVLFSAICGLCLPAHADDKATYDKEILYQIRFGQAETAKALLAKGADPNQANELGWPLVSIAASRRDGQAEPLLRALVEAGADINQGGPSHMFPVIVAARSGDASLMHYLLTVALADPEKKDPNGASARDVAAEGSYDDIVAEIDRITATREASRKAMVDPARRDVLIRDVIVEGCAREYMTYYYASKQDPATPEQVDQGVGVWSSKLTLAINDLAQIFHYPADSAALLAQQGSTAVFNQFETLISNRNRRAHGVGSPGDVEKRCGAIADAALKANAEAAEAKEAKRNAKRRKGTE